MRLKLVDALSYYVARPHLLRKSDKPVELTESDSLSVNPIGNFLAYGENLEQYLRDRPDKYKIIAKAKGHTVFKMLEF